MSYDEESMFAVSLFLSLDPKSQDLLLGLAKALKKAQAKQEKKVSAPVAVAAPKTGGLEPLDVRARKQEMKKAPAEKKF